VKHGSPAGPQEKRGPRCFVLQQHEAEWITCAITIRNTNRWLRIYRSILAKNAQPSPTGSSHLTLVVITRPTPVITRPTPVMDSCVAWPANLSVSGSEPFPTLGSFSLRLPYVSPRPSCIFSTMPFSNKMGNQTFPPRISSDGSSDRVPFPANEKLPPTVFPPLAAVAY